MFWISQDTNIAIVGWRFEDHL